MSFFGRIAARAAATGPVLQPKDAGVRRAAAPEEEDSATAMRSPVRRTDAKPPENEPKAARASAKPDEEMKEPAASHAPARAMRAGGEGEEPKAQRASADERQQMHRAGAPEDEPQARPSRRAPAAAVHDPEPDDAMHRAATKEEPQDEPLRRAGAPGPEELTPENSPVPNDPPQTGVKPLVMALRREASPAVPAAAPAADFTAVDAGTDSAAVWAPVSEPERTVAQAPFANAYEPPGSPLFAPQSLRFDERPDVVIDRIDVLVQEPPARVSGGSERSASRSLRARYLRSL